jgi:hypothetical protein
MKRRNDIMKNLRNELLEMSAKETGIKLFVINDLLSLENDSEIKDYMNDVLCYGCQSGIVTSLIYTSDTKNFIKKYLEECLEILDEFIQQIGKPAFIIDSNSIAWLAYEETLRNLVVELDLDI